MRAGAAAVAAAGHVDAARHDDNHLSEVVLANQRRERADALLQTRVLAARNQESVAVNESGIFQGLAERLFTPPGFFLQELDKHVRALRGDSFQFGQRDFRLAVL